MKIKNKNVIIKSGKKIYELHNMILDEYLKRFAKLQTDPGSSNAINRTMLRYAYLKFDNPIGFDEKSAIDVSNFDIALTYHGSIQYNQTLSSQKIETRYQYDFVEYDYNVKAGLPDASQYYGKKIATIGFSSWFTNTTACCMIDVTNYNIYFDENFSITRNDIITTDAMFYSQFSNISGPVHLAPLGTDPVIYEPPFDDGLQYYHRAYSAIYSIGMSSYIDRMDFEYVFGKDIDYELDEENAQIVFEGIKNKEEHALLQPNVSLFVNNRLMPVMVEGGQHYKYIIVKYELWQYVTIKDGDDYSEILTDTDEWYYQAIPIDETGILTFRIKYERG